MKLSALLLTSVALLSGCAQRVWYQPQTRQFSTPPLGEVVSVGLGEPLLAKGEVRDFDALFLASPQNVGSISLPSGYYSKESTLGYAETFHPSDEARQMFSRAGIQIRTIFVVKQGALCVDTLPGGIACLDNAKFERKAWSVSDKAGGFQQTLIYSGRVGNKINAVYRESSDGYARPAFDNRIEYDLGESNTIGYKGARVEVLEATNQQIKYRVLKHFAD